MSDEITKPVGPQGQEGTEPDSSFFTYGDRVLVMSGYSFVFASVASFVGVGVLKLMNVRAITEPYNSWLGLFSREMPMISLLLIGIVTALLGQRLLATARMASARTIPKEDLPLIADAVKAANGDAIDQYVRLRSLSGWAGNFTKLGIRDCR